MASYLITGISGAIGFEFARQLSAIPGNTVIGLVRNPEAAQKRVSELQRSNIHIIQADLTDLQSLKKSVPVVSQLVDGKLDYLIANAGFIPLFKHKAYDPIGELAKDPEQFDKDMLENFKINAVGTTHLISFYMPMILKGQTKKILVISSGMGDDAFTREYNITQQVPYSMSKAAVNMAVAKFSAQYAEEGVLCLSMCPGSVENGQYDGASEEDLQKLGKMGEKFLKYSPTFKGAETPEQSVTAMLSLLDKASVEDGYGGAFISHHGRGEKWIK